MSTISTPTGVTEVRRSRVSVGQFGLKSRGTLVYSCTTDNVMYNFSASLTGRSVTFNPKFPPMRVVSVKEEVNDPSMSGRARLTVVCEGASPEMHQLNRAFLTYRLIPHGQEMTIDLKGDVIRGTRTVFKQGTNVTYAKEELGFGDVNAVSRHFAPEDGGRIIRYEGTEEITLHTAYSREDINWGWIASKKFKINTKAMPLLNGVKAGEVKLMGAGVPKYHIQGPEDEVVPINFTFYLHPGKGPWPKTEWVKEYELAPVVTAVTGEDGKGNAGMLTEDFVVTQNYQEAKKVIVMQERVFGRHERVINKAVDMSDIHGLLRWK